MSRQAQLLVRVEGFSLVDTAMVLDITPEEVSLLLGQLEQEKGAQPVAQTLIIEDEPLISLQLESLVAELGHNVIGSAPTRRQAVHMAKNRTIDLVLSDVQLADNSSGIDAVMEIQKAATPWVIFITAYPERLLTGDRPEPLFLLSKPFDSDAVKATISQALFLARSGRPSATLGA
jgi:DNA-binding LytR/AlgR family response regulator